MATTIWGPSVQGGQMGVTFQGVDVSTLDANGQVYVTAQILWRSTQSKYDSACNVDWVGNVNVGYRHGIGLGYNPSGTGIANISGTIYVNEGASMDAAITATASGLSWAASNISVQARFAIPRRAYLPPEPPLNGTDGTQLSRTTPGGNDYATMSWGKNPLRGPSTNGYMLGYRVSKPEWENSPVATNIGTWYNTGTVNGYDTTTGELGPLPRGYLLLLGVAARNPDGEYSAERAYPRTYSGSLIGRYVRTQPLTPTLNRASRVSGTQTQVSWTFNQAPFLHNSTGYAQPNGWQLQFSSDGGTSWTDVPSQPNGTDRMYTHTGLDPAKQYSYKIRAFVYNDGTAQQVWSSWTPSSDPTGNMAPPDAPTGLFVSGPGANDIEKYVCPTMPWRMNWSYYAPDGTVQTGSIVHWRKQNADSTWGTWTEEPTVVSGNFYQDMTGFSPGNYEFRVQVRGSSPTWSTPSGAIFVTLANPVAVSAPAISSTVASSVLSLNMSYAGTAHPTQFCKLRIYEAATSSMSGSTVFATVDSFDNTSTGCKVSVPGLKLGKFYQAKVIPVVQGIGNFDDAQWSAFSWTSSVFAVSLQPPSNYLSVNSSYWDFDMEAAVCLVSWSQAMPDVAAIEVTDQYGRLVEVYPLTAAQVASSGSISYIDGKAPIDVPDIYYRFRTISSSGVKSNAMMSSGPISSRTGKPRGILVSSARFGFWFVNLTLLGGGFKIQETMESGIAMERFAGDAYPSATWSENQGRTFVISGLIQEDVYYAAANKWQYKDTGKHFRNSLYNRTKRLVRARGLRVVGYMSEVTIDHVSAEWIKISFTITEAEEVPSWD